MNDASERVILVDDEDREIGTAPKLLAHERGNLHRAFSVMIHDRNGCQLLQKRHLGKYHSGAVPISRSSSSTKMTRSLASFTSVGAFSGVLSSQP